MDRQWAAPSIVHEVLATAGQPLHLGLRSQMESRFGLDFSRVQIHADSRAAQSASAVNARAYTVGDHIVIGAGHYPEATTETQRLLAHELTHVLQQQPYSSSRQLLVGKADTPEEREAETAAQALKAPNHTLLGSSARPTRFLQRKALLSAGIDELAGDLAGSDLAVEDGSSPVGELDPLDELSESQAQSGLIENAQVEEPAAALLARAPAGKSRATATKTAPKPKPPVITDIDIDLAKQKMTLRWSDGSSETHTVSTGKGCPNTAGNPCATGNEAYCTPDGEFVAGSKGDADTTNSHGDKMSWFVRVKGGIGIHDSQPADGTPRSHGCIRLGIGTAADALAKKINMNVNRHTKIHISGTAPARPWSATKKEMEAGHFDDCPPPRAPTTPRRRAGSPGR